MIHGFDVLDLMEKARACQCSSPARQQRWVRAGAAREHGREGASHARAQAPTDEKDRPVTEIKLERITIHANPLAT